MNLADEAPSSIYELAGMVGSWLDSSSEPLSNPWYLHVDTSLARSLGLRPSIRTGHQAWHERGSQNLVVELVIFARKGLSLTRYTSSVVFVFALKGLGPTTRYSANRISLKNPCLYLQRLDPQIGFVHLLRPGNWPRRVSRIRPATKRKLVTAAYKLR